jgi:hypothetical protein
MTAGRLSLGSIVRPHGHAMPMFPLGIQFVDADHACERFHSFPPDDLDYIEGWSRKRDGDSQMILLHLATEAHLQDFLALCRLEGSIVAVTPITEDEFRRAKSNAI